MALVSTVRMAATMAADKVKTVATAAIEKVMGVSVLRFVFEVSLLLLFNRIASCLSSHMCNIHALVILFRDEYR